MPKSQVAIDYAIGIVDQIDPTGINGKILRTQLEALDDDAYDRLMDKFEEKELTLTFEYPVFGPVKIDVKRNHEIALSLGHDFYQQLIFGSSDKDTPAFISPPKYFVIPTPTRRTVQLLEEGISVAKDNNSVDHRTGTVTGASATSKLSYPETGILEGMSMDRVIKEIASVRGGDLGAWEAFEALFNRDGEASIENIDVYSTGPESVKAYSTLLKAMHINNTL